MSEFDMHEAQDVFGDTTSSSSNGNSNSGNSNIPEFMRKPPLQKGFWGFCMNIFIMAFVAWAWMLYGLYLIIPKTANFIKGLFNK